MSLLQNFVLKQKKLKPESTAIFTDFGKASKFKYDNK